MKNIKRFYLLPLLTIVAAFCFSIPAYSLPAGFFAENSVLAEGRWIKIEVSGTGMNLIPAASLRAMGFSDLSKVNVYGSGGRMLPEALYDTMTDDLSLLPSVKTDKGIIFFATDVTSWEKGKDVPYTHTLNPYDTKSYYFLSDREVKTPLQMEKVGAPSASASKITTFTERLLHESELAGPAESGRTIFGEDFRTTRTRTFPFTLNGLAGDSATVKIRFAAKSSSATSFLVSVNGTRLPSTTDDRIKESTVATEFTKVTTSVKKFKLPGSALNLELTYSPAGTVGFARLDYIEVFYPRTLSLEKGTLYFYTSDSDAEAAEIEGCSADTRIWDVTDPTRPKEMEFSLSGSKASIALSSGYHEYVAFNPTGVVASAPQWQPVTNQNIHGMETPDMLIITFDEYMDAAERIADLHRNHDGMTVHVLRPEDIYNEFSGGSADVTAFRKIMKMWYDRGGEHTLRYCLLLGRPHFDNRLVTAEAKALGYRPMPIWEDATSFTDAGSYSTDCYIAMLDDCAVGFSMSGAKQRVAVGRIPVTTTQEANDMAAKIENYVLNPNYGAWRNKMMIVADDIDDASMSDTPATRLSTFFDQSQTIYDILRQTEEGRRYIYDRIYLDAHKLESTSVGLRYPTAQSRMLSNFNEGVVFTNYLGHANTTSWSHEKILTLDDIKSLNNRNLGFMFGGTCDFAHWDGYSVSGAEMMVLNPTAGVIAMVMPSRTVYITQNFQLNRAMTPYLLKKNEKGERGRFGDYYVGGMNDLVDSNKLRYCLIGDPALTFPLPINIVEIESINGVDITSPEVELPELPALGKIRLQGGVLDSEGNPDEDFSGLLELILFDAEKVVETKNLGKGLDRAYNERKTRLATTSVRVDKGRWEANIVIPAEIDNNYAPALITAYAYNTTTGEEAHGMTENLYVYGYDDESEPDEKAPEIESLYLNSPSFTDGAVVNGNPIFFATLFDESGINISDAGIGHKMNLCLDGKKIYSDVNLFFTPDSEREGAGTVCYPLEDIEPGKHTLTFNVWDNANNSASRTIEFNVGAALDPVISDLSTNVNPASTSVVFNVTIDRPNSKVDCLIEVFDLLGRPIWQSHSNVTTDMQSSLSASWDLRDSSGVRVPRGIYLYRATVKTPEGTYSSKSRKLAVTAQ
ncbi:MAG: type IX secretion system sortase PorU [Muribaculaceae bacterium]|nr:type IX secretion system sortase PorU [Muribaculaceae bacterium]